jgi:hypothetical protein
MDFFLDEAWEFIFGDRPQGLGQIRRGFDRGWDQGVTAAIAMDADLGGRRQADAG